MSWASRRETPRDLGTYEHSALVATAAGGVAASHSEGGHGRGVGVCVGEVRVRVCGVECGEGKALAGGRRNGGAPRF